MRMSVKATYLANLLLCAKKQVVPYESSLVGHARKEIAVGLPGNHSKICKFSGPDDPAYRSVLGALQDYVQDAVLSSG